MPPPATTPVRPPARYGELLLGGFPFLELGLPSEASLAIAAIMVVTPPAAVAYRFNNL